MNQKIDELVNRFLGWPLPDSVCSDLCATKAGYPHRSGTNLLTATEAKAMLEYVLVGNREATEGGEKPHWAKNGETGEVAISQEPSSPPAPAALDGDLLGHTVYDTLNKTSKFVSVESGATAGTAREFYEKHKTNVVNVPQFAEAYAADLVRQERETQIFERNQLSAFGENILKQKGGWPECNDQPSRVKKLEKELAEEREARERAEQERDAIKKKYATLVFTIDGNFECLSTCDSYGHDEKCPNMEAAEKILLLGERAERAERALREAITICEAAKNEYERKGNNDAWEVGFTYGAGVCAEKIEALAQVKSSEREAK